MNNNSRGAVSTGGKNAHTAKNKNKKKKTGKYARTVFVVLMCLLVVIMLVAAIVGGYVVVNIISFAHGEPAIDLEDYKMNQNHDHLLLHSE